MFRCESCAVYAVYSSLINACFCKKTEVFFEVGSPKYHSFWSVSGGSGSDPARFDRLRVRFGN